MLQLRRSSALEGVYVAIRRKAERIPKSDWRLNAQLALKGPQRRVGVKGPVTPSLSCQTILEEHADDCHHCQSSVRQLGCQFLLFHLRVVDLYKAVWDAQESCVLKVSWWALGIIHVLKELNGACECNHLSPAGQWHFRECGKTCWHIAELQAKGWRQISWPAVVLWDNVPKASEHGHPSVLQLHIASAAEGGSIVGLGKPEGVPKADRRLHTQLSFECRGSCVQTIRCTEQAILHPQAQNGHHRQAPIGQFGIQGTFSALRILHGLCCDAQHHVAIAELALAIVAWVRWVNWSVDAELVAATQGNPLQPALSRHFGYRGDTIGNVGKFQVRRRSQVPWELEVLGNHVADGCEHCHPSVLQLRLATSAESL
mmetsp:Transcript_75768/g.120049  ORF Transcript_75768/g.120049 Transcript_75768/m.120049 type:complete len:371 (+) Transcript_75768:498-1610(+)